MEATEGSFTDFPVCRSAPPNAVKAQIDDGGADQLPSPVIEKDELGFITLNMDEPSKERDESKKKKKDHSKENNVKDLEDGATDGPGDLRQGSIRNASTIRCRRPNCKRSLPAEEARVKFRTCSNCYTFYCSRQCRKAHYERHKSQCPRTRISNLCTQVLMRVREDPSSRRHLSICATRGLLSRGRGVVKLVFLNAEDALDYLRDGWEALKGQTFYVPRTELMPQEMGTEVFAQVRILCDKYNTDRKFILLAAISVTTEVQSESPEGTVTVSMEREVVVRGVKMRLAPPLPEDEVQTLICTITNDPPVDGQTELTREDLQRGLDTINAQMEERGVDLATAYPEVYGKIALFVEKREPFIPFNIFPVDKRTGKMFMCILLPWADDEIIMKISSKTTASRSRRKWII